MGSLGEKHDERGHGSKEERPQESVNLGKIQGEKKWVKKESEIRSYLDENRAS